MNCLNFCHKKPDLFDPPIDASAPLLNDESNKLANAQVKRQIGSVSTGGLISVMLFPLVIYDAINKFFETMRQGDCTSLIERSIEILKIPNQFAIGVNSAFRIVTILAQGVAIAILGVAYIPLCASLITLELVIEICRTVKLLYFKHETQIDERVKILTKIKALEHTPSSRNRKEQMHACFIKHRKALRKTLSESDFAKLFNEKEETSKLLEMVKRTLVQKTFSYLQKTYLSTEKEEDMKKLTHRLTQLSNKVGSSTAKQMLCESANYINTDDHTQIDRGVNLMEQIQLKSDKTLTIHIIGLIALLIGIASFSLYATGAPYLIIVGSMIFGTLMEWSRYFGPDAYIETEGHKLDIIGSLQTWLKSIYDSVFPLPSCSCLRQNRNHVDMDPSYSRM